MTGRFSFHRRLNMTENKSLGIATRDQAQFEANRLMEYWGKRGYEVRAWVIPHRSTAQGKGEGAINNYTGFTVRTDMVGGWPIKLQGERQRALLA